MKLPNTGEGAEVIPLLVFSGATADLPVVLLELAARSTGSIQCKVMLQDFPPTPLLDPNCK